VNEVAESFVFGAPVKDCGGLNMFWKDVGGILISFLGAFRILKASSVFYRSLEVSKLYCSLNFSTSSMEIVEKLSQTTKSYETNSSQTQFFFSKKQTPTTSVLVSLPFLQKNSNIPREVCFNLKSFYCHNLTTILWSYYPISEPH
jgi:hypothetical protein